MRKNVFGRQLKRDTNERKALFKGLISSLILSGRIKTTEAKAKAIKGQVDKIINRAKKSKTRAFPLLQPYLSQDALGKLVFEIAPQYDKRSGGYTRLVRLGRRFSDNAPLMLLELVEGDRAKPTEKPTTTETQKKTKTQNFSGSENFNDSVVAKKISAKRKVKKK